MPKGKVHEESAEALGRLLRIYGEPVGLTPRSGIAGVRRDRLRDALTREGVDVSAHAASVLADGMASGQLVINETYLHLVSDGGTGVKATCRCRSGRGGCTLQTQGGKTVLCYSPEGKCKNCEFSLNLIVAGVKASARKPAQLGAEFADQLPDVFVEAISALAALSYPVVDRLNLHEQTEPLPIGGQTLLSQLTFPVLTLPDALDRLLTSARSAPSAPAANLLRLAVGDYPDTIPRSLATAVAAGAVDVDDETRSVAVRARSKPDGGVTVDVECVCSVYGSCLLTYTKSTLGCVPSELGCRGNCVIAVRIPTAALAGR